MEYFQIGEKVHFQIRAKEGDVEKVMSCDSHRMKELFDTWEQEMGSKKRSRLGLEDFRLLLAFNEELKKAHSNGVNGKTTHEEVLEDAMVETLNLENGGGIRNGVICAREKFIQEVGVKPFI